MYLHLRFHGYGDGKWTDSAVRRYVTDAGPLLRAAAQAGARGLHHPQQAPGRRGCRPPTTIWSTASPSCAAKEDLQRVRPDLDGNEIMRDPRHPAGPGGRARRGSYLKELRLDRGPLSHDEATAELQKWWERAGTPSAGT